MVDAVPGRRTRAAALAPAAALSLLVGACEATGGTGGTGDTGDTGSTAPDTTTTEAPAAERAIHDFDFGSARWTDSRTGQTVTLRDGTATTEGDFTVELTLTGEPEHLDLDGDGDDDALVTLSGTEGDTAWDYTYAWLWDEDAGEPVQVTPALTDDARCGNVTQDITAEDGRITVTYLDRRAGSEPCGEEPTVQATRVIELTGTWAYQVEPARSALGECGEPASDLLTPAEAQLPGGGLHAAPAEDAPYVVEWDDIDRVALPEELMRDLGLPPGWTRVLFTVPGQSADDLSMQCGFVLTS